MFWLVNPASTRVRVSKSTICRRVSFDRLQILRHSTYWVVVVGVPSLKRVSDLSDIVLLVADGREDALYGRQSKTRDTVCLCVLQLGESTTEQSSGGTGDEAETSQRDSAFVVGFGVDSPHLVEALVTRSVHRSVVETCAKIFHGRETTSNLSLRSESPRSELIWGKLPGGSVLRCNNLSGLTPAVYQLPFRYLDQCYQVALTRRQL